MISPYQHMRSPVLAAHIVATEKYGYTPFHWYMLTRDGKVIADDGSKMTFATHGAEIDENREAQAQDAVSFDYEDGDTRYELTLTRQKTLVAYTWIDFAKGWEKELMKLIRYPGGYMRFLAATSLDCYRGRRARRALREDRRVRADLLPAPDPRGVAGARHGRETLGRSGAPGWNRTSDTRFRKPVLYPLSYEGIVPICRYLSARIDSRKNTRVAKKLRNLRETCGSAPQTALSDPSRLPECPRRLATARHSVAASSEGSHADAAPRSRPIAARVGSRPRSRQGACSDPPARRRR